MGRSVSEAIFREGEKHEDYFGAVSPPLIQTSNFAFESVADYRKAVADEKQFSIYTRGLNPTTAILNKKLAALEGMDDALSFGSGSAAISAAVMNTVKAGDHVVCVENPYSWTHQLFTNYLPEYGVECTFVDGKVASNYEKATKDNTKLYFLESPNSLTFELQDIEAITTSAKEKGIKTILDNSYASPIGQRSADLGIDVAVHSATKYLSGHSDVVAGVVCADEETIRSIFFSEFMTLGGVQSPHDSWLMLRSLRTLELRMQRSSESALKIAEALTSHPKVTALYYPYHSSHPQHVLAEKQMKYATGMFSFKVDCDDMERLEAFSDGLEKFIIACSWGGYESLILPCCVFSGKEKNTLPINLFRLYVGLENADELIEDLTSGLNKL